MEVEEEEEVVVAEPVSLTNIETTLQNARAFRELLQIVIMDHGAGVTVEIEYKVMDHKIADDFIYIYRSFERFVLAFIQIFQRFDQPCFVSIGWVGLGIVEYIGITFKLVISINKGYITAARALREVPAP